MKTRLNNDYQYDSNKSVVETILIRIFLSRKLPLLQFINIKKINKQIQIIHIYFCIIQ